MITALLDLVLPRLCDGCRQETGSLCPSCRQVLGASPLGQVRPSPCPPGLPEVCSFAPYDGPVKHLLLAHKERGALHLSRPLGSAVAAALEGAPACFGPGPLVLCPVPSSRTAVRDRGYDHAWRLTFAASRALSDQGWTVRARRLLVATRRTADQAGLSTAERAANLNGALRGVAASPSRVVVVDDVMTTGATLVEAARALTAAGHEVAGAAVVAATRRRRERPNLR